MRPHYTRIPILILEVWEFLRLRVAFSENFESFWGESSFKILRKFLSQPQKPSNFEVRMRSMVLRIFENSSKFLEKYSLKSRGFSRILEKSDWGQPSKNLKFRGENEGNTFEVEGQVLRVSISKKFENLMRVILENSQTSRGEWGQHFWGFCPP